MTLELDVYSATIILLNSFVIDYIIRWYELTYKFGDNAV